MSNNDNFVKEENKEEKLFPYHTFLEENSVDKTIFDIVLNSMDYIIQQSSDARFTKESKDMLKEEKQKLFSTSYADEDKVCLTTNDAVFSTVFGYYIGCGKLSDIDLWTRKHITNYADMLKPVDDLYAKIEESENGLRDILRQYRETH